MRVCLYTRISTDEDHQPTSLTTQRERLERYCQAMDDWHVVSAFEDQASGVTLDQPGLHHALELARERRFDLLLVYRVDRSHGRYAKSRDWPRALQPDHDG